MNNAVPLMMLLFIAASAAAQSAPASPGSGATPQLQKGPDLPAGVPMPLKVHLAVSFVGIPKITDMARTFDGAIDVETRWRDPRLAFDFKSQGTDRMDFGPDAAPAELARIWNPGLLVTNMKQTDARVEHGLSIAADGWVRHVQRIRATFDAPIQLRKYPFDTQTLPIHIASPLYNINQVILVQDQHDIDSSRIDRSADVPAWQIERLEFVSFRPHNWSGGYTSEMEARLIVSRKSLYPLTVILTPFLLVLVVPSIYVLYITVETAHQFNSWTSSILALIALSFTFSVRFPNGSEGIVMQLVNTGFLYQLTMIGVLVANKKLTPRYPGVMNEVMGFLRWAAPLALLVAMAARIGLIAYS